MSRLDCNATDAEIISDYENNSDMDFHEGNDSGRICRTYQRRGIR